MKNPPPKADLVDQVVSEWGDERPDLEAGALGVALRIQMLAKAFTDEASKELVELGLEWWEYDALSVLRRQGEPYILPATEIADSAMLSPGAMTNRIDQLEERGLVERKEDAEDRRKVLVGLTVKGVDLVDRASEARFKSADAVLADLSTREQSELCSLLRKVVLSQA